MYIMNWKHNWKTFKFGQLILLIPLLLLLLHLLLSGVCMVIELIMRSSRRRSYENQSQTSGSGFRNSNFRIIVANRPSWTNLLQFCYAANSWQFWINIYKGHLVAPGQRNFLVSSVIFFQVFLLELQNSFFVRHKYHQCSEKTVWP